jgi:hypothetical protein
MINIYPVTPIAPACMIIRPDPGLAFEADRRWTLIGFSWRLEGLGAVSEAIYVDRNPNPR